MTMTASSRDARRVSAAQPSNKSPRSQIARLRVTTDICPQVFSRVLGLIAQQDIVPVAMNFEHRARSLRFEIAVAGLAPHPAALIAAKVGEMVRVRSARWDGIG